MYLSAEKEKESEAFPLVAVILHIFFIENRSHSYTLTLEEVDALQKWMTINFHFCYMVGPSFWWNVHWNEHHLNRLKAFSWNISIFWKNWLLSLRCCLCISFTMFSQMFHWIFLLLFYFVLVKFLKVSIKKNNFIEFMRLNRWGILIKLVRSLALCKISSETWKWHNFSSPKTQKAENRSLTTQIINGNKHSVHLFDWIFVEHKDQLRNFIRHNFSKILWPNFHLHEHGFFFNDNVLIGDVHTLENKSTFKNDAIWTCFTQTKAYFKLQLSSFMSWFF